MGGQGMISYLSRGRVQNMRLNSVIRKLEERALKKKGRKSSKNKKAEQSSMLCLLKASLILDFVYDQPHWP